MKLKQISNQKINSERCWSRNLLILESSKFLVIDVTGECFPE